MRRPYVEVLELHYYEGLPVRRMAEILGLSTNNVKVRLHRARNALRRDLLAQGVTGRFPGEGAPGAPVRAASPIPAAGQGLGSPPACPASLARAACPFPATLRGPGASPARPAFPARAVAEEVAS